VIPYSEPYGSVQTVIPLAQHPDKPIWNTDQAMRKACESPVVSDPFIWSNDDIYWRRPVSLEELISHSKVAKGQLPIPNPAQPAKGLYARLETTTFVILAEHSLQTYSYERHVPLLVHKREMLEALAMQASKRSIYGNLMNVKPEFVRHDVKLFAATDKLPDIEIEPWFSTGNAFPHGLISAML
jgi:hypothetical protein